MKYLACDLELPVTHPPACPAALTVLLVVRVRECNSRIPRCTARGIRGPAARTGSGYASGRHEGPSSRSIRMFMRVRMCSSGSGMIRFLLLSRAFGGSLIRMLSASETLFGVPFRFQSWAGDHVRVCGKGESGGVKAGCNCGSRACDEMILPCRSLIIDARARAKNVLTPTLTSPPALQAGRDGLQIFLSPFKRSRRGGQRLYDKQINCRYFPLCESARRRARFMDRP